MHPHAVALACHWLTRTRKHSALRYNINRVHYPCTVCKFSVCNNHKAILCDICQNWTHLKCTPFTCEEYIALSNTNEDWFCSVCLATLFPFNHFEDDTDFFFALFDFNFEGNFDPELLKQKVFNPFFDDPETSHLLMNSNLDPNPNFFYRKFRITFELHISNLFRI